MRLLPVLLLATVGALAAEAVAQVEAPKPRQHQKNFMRIDLGGSLGFTFNSAYSQYRTTENRFGLGIATNVEFGLGDFDFDVLLAFMRHQSLGMTQDGATNTNICSEGFFSKIFDFPGPCGQLQVRLQPMLWSDDWGAGITLAFNHVANYTYKEVTIYNTKWNYWALGPAVGYRIRWQSFSLVSIAHFDYGFDSSSPASQKIQAWQLGVNVYALFAVF